MNSGNALFLSFIRAAVVYKLNNPTATHYGYSSYEDFVYPWTKKYFLKRGLFKEFDKLNNEQFFNLIAEELKKGDRGLAAALADKETDVLDEEDLKELKEDTEKEKEKLKEDKKEREHEQDYSEIQAPKETAEESTETEATPTEPKITPEQTVEKLEKVYQPPANPKTAPETVQHLEKIAETSKPLPPTPQTPIQTTAHLENIAESAKPVQALPTTPEQAANYLSQQKQEENKQNSDSGNSLSPKQLRNLLNEEPRVIIAESPASPPTQVAQPSGPTSSSPSSSWARPSAPSLRPRLPSGGLKLPGLSGTGGLLRGGGAKLAGGAGRLAAGAARAGAMLAFSNPYVAAALVIGVILGIILLYIFTQFNRPESILGIGGGTAEAGSISSVGDISSCVFYRGDRKPPGAQYKSDLLLSYFEEASKLTGAPAALLAAFTRVESPGVTDLSNEGVKNYQCANSPTGALGIMQIQPKGTKGHDPISVANGAKLLGIDYDALTEADYCDVRKNIIMGAGFILKKLSYKGYGDGTKWDPAWTTDKKAIDALVTGYYGCLLYGGSSDCTGPYSYGDDVFKSASECKPAKNVIANASCPIPNGKIGCASYGPKESWSGFDGSCRVDSTGNGGHCNKNYINDVGICTTPKDKEGNLIRTAKSIDISANSKSGDPVYLPKINGKDIQWSYEGVVSAGGDFGWIRLFKSINTPEGVWSLHFVHVNLSDPSLKIGQTLPSGSIGGTLFPQSWPHLHLTVGLNVGDSINDLKDYSPNWKFADRDLGVCTQ